jgi:hypothetical protein
MSAISRKEVAKVSAECLCESIGCAQSNVAFATFDGRHVGLWNTYHLSEFRLRKASNLTRGLNLLSKESRRTIRSPLQPAGCRLLWRCLFRGQGDSPLFVRMTH